MQFLYILARFKAKGIVLVMVGNVVGTVVVVVLDCWEELPIPSIVPGIRADADLFELAGTPKSSSVRVCSKLNDPPNSKSTPDTPRPLIGSSLSVIA